MRAWLVVAHRWFGLSCALFLTVAGLTGAVIAWDHELDAWLNPAFYRTGGTAAPLQATELAARLERAEPALQVRYLPLAVAPGETLSVFVEPRPDPATGALAELGYSQVALDPASGEVLARREWGRAALDREHLLPFLYKLHYSLHLPDAFGLPLGTLFMGGIAIVWLLDTLLALIIAFPSRRSWRQSFAFRWRAGGYRLNFDLHRSGGVWLFPLLLTLALTSVSMNLKEEVMRPLLGAFSSLTPSPATLRSEPPTPGERVLELTDIVAIAEHEARARGITAPAGGVWSDSLHGVYGVGFFAAGASHGDRGLGNPWLYFDARDGRTLGAEVPGSGTVGDIFLQAMFPLHSGRIAGLAGRIVVSACGLLIAALCITGLVIWARKRRARRHAGRVRAPLTAGRKFST